MAPNPSAHFPFNASPTKRRKRPPMALVMFFSLVAIGFGGVFLAYSVGQTIGFVRLATDHTETTATVVDKDFNSTAGGARSGPRSNYFVTYSYQIGDNRYEDRFEVSGAYHAQVQIGQQIPIRYGNYDATDSMIVGFGYESVSGWVYIAFSFGMGLLLIVGTVFSLRRQWRA